MVMAVRKRAKKDMRSSITVQLSAAHADLVVEILSKELDVSRRERGTSRSFAIMDIMKSFCSAIELEERQRALRGKKDGAEAEKTDENKKLRPDSEIK